MITVTNLSYRYEDGCPEVISDIDFQIKEGEVFGFLGPSGAGKSTTQKILTGQLRDYTGTVVVAGEEIKTARRSIYNKLGVAFEFPNLYEKLTAIENLKLFGAFYNRNMQDPSELLKMVNLSDEKNTLVSSFSKGMKMRLNFVRSIMHNPEILFLDEPTSGLDPVNARIIKDIIRKLKYQGTTIFLTTHNMTDAESLCDELALIDNGKFVLTGNPSDLKIKYGTKKLRLTYLDNNIHRNRDFSLNLLGSDTEFLEILKKYEIETIHSNEATLEDIFIEVTGHALSGSETEMIDHA
ncbi:MAG TPA: ABC transporter ATP-binding protein [Bacteroidales bacterium]|nr:ABC transporter ATP-binding protein [Bacteroidales bacterium]